MLACLYRLATWMNKVSDPNVMCICDYSRLACFIVRQALQGFNKLTYVVVKLHSGPLWLSNPESSSCESLVLMWQVGKMVFSNS
jgi:hypothetical protein